MKKLKISMLLGLLLSSLTAQSDPIDVYLVTGQSNVRQEWADGIEPQLNTLFTETRSVTVVDRYPGNQLRRWWNNGPEENFTTNIDALEAAFSDLRSQGHEPVLKGLFWFQGESDWGRDNETSAYKSRFTSYVQRLSSEMGVNDIEIAIAVNDVNQDPIYDDPDLVKGATRSDIEEFRNILFELADDLDALAFDTRGYFRDDSVHLSLDALRDLGEDMATRFYEEVLQNNEASPSPSPTLLSIPGRIEAENFTTQSGTRVEPTGDVGGGSNVGFIDSADHLSFTANVTTPGTYELQIRAASPRSGSYIDVTVNGNSAGQVDIPNTGGWQDYTTVALDIDLSSGNQTIRLNFGGGNKSLANVNWLNTALINDQSGRAETTVVMQKNNTEHSIDGNRVTLNEGLPAYLYATNQANVNQQWVETNQGGEYYSYKKMNTNLCLDGGDGAGNGQAITTEQCSDDNQNQHWSKNFLTNGTVRLEKRGTSHSIDGKSNAGNRQTLHLWRSSDSNINQQWEFLTPR